MTTRKHFNLKEKYMGHIKCTLPQNYYYPGSSEIITDRSNIVESCEDISEEQCENSWVPVGEDHTGRDKVSFGCTWRWGPPTFGKPEMGCFAPLTQGITGGESTCEYLNVGKACGTFTNQETCENLYNETKCLWDNETGTCSQDAAGVAELVNCPRNPAHWGCQTGLPPPHINLCGYTCMEGLGPFPDKTELCNPNAPNPRDYVFCEPPYNNCANPDPGFPQELKCCKRKGDCQPPRQLL